jgi:hypothetical protein
MRSALQRVGVALAGGLLATSVVAAPASAEPAALTGTVVDAADGSAVPACVNVYDTGYGWVHQACTDDTGTWTTTNTEAGGTYEVEISRLTVSTCPDGHPTRRTSTPPQR